MSVAARDAITAVVLGDGTPEPALRTAHAARAYAARVLLAERHPDTARELARHPLPPDVAVVSCDWGDAASARELLAGLDTPWTLFLAPGERPDARDRAAFEREWVTLTPGAVTLSTGDSSETRLHPPCPEALAAVGAPAPRHMESLRIVALREGGTVPTLDEERGAGSVTPGLGVLAAELPAALRDPRRFAAAVRGDDLDALERLGAVLERHEERRLLEVVRAGRDVCWTDEHEAEPLVTIRIATYHRPEWIGRAIESCLAQTWQRVEGLVVGERCSDETAAVVRGFHDPRLRFVNLPARGLYPSEPMARWRVAGVLPANTALVLGEGSWITACDDDDEFTPDHVETLLGEARRRRLEMVWSKADMEVRAGEWEVVGSEPLAEGRVTQGSVLFSMGLRFMRFSNTCWRAEQPADWNLW
ncbi:MAG: glycosyltransferase family 2 protein [bacterium]